MNRLKRILVADDNPEAADTLGLLLELSDRPVSVRTTYTGSSAIDLADKGQFNIIILALRISKHSNLHVAQSIRLQKNINPPRLIILFDHFEQIATLWERPIFDEILPRSTDVSSLLNAIYRF